MFHHRFLLLFGCCSSFSSVGLSNRRFTETVTISLPEFLSGLCSLFGQTMGGNEGPTLLDRTWRGGGASCPYSWVKVDGTNAGLIIPSESSVQSELNCFISERLKMDSLLVGKRGTHGNTLCNFRGPPPPKKRSSKSRDCWAGGSIWVFCQPVPGLKSYISWVQIF